MQFFNLKDLAKEEGIQYRYDCPFCNGKNTFSVKKELGKIYYNCFKNSCDQRKSRGVLQYVRTLNELKEDSKKKEEQVFTVPDYIEYGICNERMVNELKSKHAWEAYVNNYISIGYDPKEDRLIFFIKEQNKIVGMVGKSLSKGLPKTKTYRSSIGVLEVGRGSTAVVVEDVLSACSVSRDARYTGVPLCGTTLKVEHIDRLDKYKRIIIALDKDASRKALKYHHLLSFIYKDVRLSLLDKDLKDCEVFNLEKEEQC